MGLFDKYQDDIKVPPTYPAIEKTCKHCGSTCRWYWGKSFNLHHRDVDVLQCSVCGFELEADRKAWLDKVTKESSK